MPIAACAGRHGGRGDPRHDPPHHPLAALPSAQGAAWARMARPGCRCTDCCRSHARAPVCRRRTTASPPTQTEMAGARHSGHAAHDHGRRPPAAGAAVLLAGRALPLPPARRHRGAARAVRGPAGQRERRGGCVHDVARGPGGGARGSRRHPLPDRQPTIPTWSGIDPGQRALIEALKRTLDPKKPDEPRRPRALTARPSAQSRLTGRTNFAPAKQCVTRPHLSADSSGDAARASSNIATTRSTLRDWSGSWAPYSRPARRSLGQTIRVTDRQATHPRRPRRETGRTAMTIEQKLRDLATTKGITRRAFMERALALGATTALATTLSGQAFAEAKQGGRFRCGLGHGATSDSLDPATFLDLYMQTVNAAARNNLTEIAQDGSLIPELAESIDTADAKTWKFTPAPGRRVPQRQDHGRERRHRVAQPPPRRGVEVGGQGAAQARRRDEGGRRERGGLHPGGRQCGLPGRAQRLPHPDHAGGRRHGGLAIRRRHRRLRARELRARRAHDAEAQSQLLQGRGSGTSTRWRSSPSPTWRRAPTR